MARRNADEKRESGVPGGGAGRRDEAGVSAVYPASAPWVPDDAAIAHPAGWRQDRRGAAGYQDHGESELIVDRVSPEKCRDIMTKNPVCCIASDSASQAAQLMKEHDIGVVPVIADSETRKLLGIVTDRDLAINVVADARDPARATAESVMSRRVVFCSPEDPWRTALDLMEKYQIRRVPIVDNCGGIVGIISQRDIALRLHARDQTGEVVEEISRPRVQNHLVRTPA